MGLLVFATVLMFLCYVRVADLSAQVYPSIRGAERAQTLEEAVAMGAIAIGLFIWVIARGRSGRPSVLLQRLVAIVLVEVGCGATLAGLGASSFGAIVAMTVVCGIGVLTTALGLWILCRTAGSVARL